MSVTLYSGDCREILRTLPDQSVHCCVTSPPYFGLRDYGHVDQIGLEATPDAYAVQMVAVFREVRRVLRNDGTLWLNMGDSYSSGGRTYQVIDTARGATSRNKDKDAASGKQEYLNGTAMRPPVVAGLGSKQLLGIPWRVAFALQADGWYLRQDIIWSKPNPMPESVTDRCTKAHEYMFLLSKSPRYYFDQDAILEPCSSNTHARLSQAVQDQIGSIRANGGVRADRPMKAVARKFDPGAGNKNNISFDAAMAIMPEKRNKRSVWTVTTRSFKEAHFATFPPALIEPCILAGCPIGGTVLDPFSGAGTTGLVADRLDRNAILIELNPDYTKIARGRLERDADMVFTPTACADC